MTSTGRTRSACFWKSGRAFLPTRSPGSKRICASAGPRRWNRKSSPAFPLGRTGSSSARMPSGRKARSSVMAPDRSRHSIRAEFEEAGMREIVNVHYSTTIPNHVNLTEDRQVLRALEGWHPGYIDWWKSMGPAGFQDALVYLRTAVSVDPKGWAKFDYVKMPEYRWGILLAPAEDGRKIPFGRHYGEPAWQEVPGEYRAMLRRLVVIQGDTEPASVEQQRHLGKTAPSLYDMRNLFQVNVEEGRHLWAMVYLLHKYFGRDGREEAEELLRRRSGSADAPRMLGAFNAGLKGRYQETKIDDDHRLENSTYPVLKLVDGVIKRVEEPALTALNMRLRDDYTNDCAKGLLRWNKIISTAGIDFAFALPH